ncbi:MAG: hypothetical protein Q9183_003245 [Haloplaca sp. 2 TL-2023]
MSVDSPETLQAPQSPKTYLADDPASSEDPQIPQPTIPFSPYAPQAPIATSPYAPESTGSLQPMDISQPTPAHQLDANRRKLNLQASRPLYGPPKHDPFMDDMMALSRQDAEIGSLLADLYCEKNRLEEFIKSFPESTLVPRPATFGKPIPRMEPMTFRNAIPNRWKQPPFQKVKEEGACGEIEDNEWELPIHVRNDLRLDASLKHAIQSKEQESGHLIVRNEQMRLYLREMGMDPDGDASVAPKELPNVKQSVENEAKMAETMTASEEKANADKAIKSVENPRSLQQAKVILQNMDPGLRRLIMPASHQRASEPLTDKQATPQWNTDNAHPSEWGAIQKAKKIQHTESEREGRESRGLSPDVISHGKSEFAAQFRRNLTIAEPIQRAGYDIEDPSTLMKPPPFPSPGRNGGARGGRRESQQESGYGSVDSSHEPRSGDTYSESEDIKKSGGEGSSAAVSQRTVKAPWQPQLYRVARRKRPFSYGSGESDLEKDLAVEEMMLEEPNENLERDMLIENMMDEDMTSESDKKDSATKDETTGETAKRRPSLKGGVMDSLKERRRSEPEGSKRKWSITAELAPALRGETQVHGVDSLASRRRSGSMEGGKDGDEEKEEGEV